MSRYLVSPDRRDCSDFRAAVVLFHHAGAAASSYVGFRHFLPEDVRVLAVQLPGRESHRNTALCNDGREAAKQIAAALREEAADLPLVFYGHSMGAALAMQTATMTVGQLKVRRVCLSSRRPPHLSPFEQNLTQANDQEVLNAVLQYGAVPEDIVADEGMREKLIDKVRADYEIAQSLACSVPSVLLDGVPLTVWGGDRDISVSLFHLHQWSSYSSGPFYCTLFPGDHFFLFNESIKPLIAEALVAELI